MNEHSKMILRAFIWAVLATMLCYLWAIFFWGVFFVGLSWEVMRIPMGLGGAVYPALFSIPLLIVTIVYQLALAFITRNMDIPRPKRLLFTLWIPFAAITVLLITFCPMDTDSNFISYFCSELLGKE